MSITILGYIELRTAESWHGVLKFSHIVEPHRSLIDYLFEYPGMYISVTDRRGFPNPCSIELARLYNDHPECTSNHVSWVDFDEIRHLVGVNRVSCREFDTVRDRHRGITATKWGEIGISKSWQYVFHSMEHFMYWGDEVRMVVLLE